MGYPLAIDAGMFNKVDAIPVTDFNKADFNLHFMISTYLKKSLEYTNWYKLPQVMIPFGGDMFFSDFESTAYVYESLIIFVESNNLSGRYAGLVKIKASLPREYFKEFKELFANDSISMASVYKQDFIPLIDNDLGQKRKPWTGFFTTCPFAKRSFRAFSDLFRGLR